MHDLLNLTKTRVFGIGAVQSQTHSSLVNGFGDIHSGIPR